MRPAGPLACWCFNHFDVVVDDGAVVVNVVLCVTVIRSSRLALARSSLKVTSQSGKLSVR